MKLGSHNSFSYLKPKHWWMYPFIPIARCQCEDIEMQYYHGARWFDLRIRFDKDGNLIVAHGLMVYKADKHTVYDTLLFLNEKAYVSGEPVYVRVLYELPKEDKSSKADNKTHLFMSFCSIIQKSFQYLIFIGGQRKYDWRKIYDFKTREPITVDMYSSCTWLKIDDWLPCLYASLMNQKNWQRFKDISPESYMLADFVTLIKN